MNRARQTQQRTRHDHPCLRPGLPACLLLLAGNLASAYPELVLAGEVAGV